MMTVLTSDCIASMGVVLEYLQESRHGNYSAKLSSDRPQGFEITFVKNIPVFFPCGIKINKHNSYGIKNIV